MDSPRRQRSISLCQPHSTTPHPSRVGVPTRLPDALGCRPSTAGGQGATLSTFPLVPLTREPTVLVFRAFSRLPVARLPMAGPWFTTPWRLVSQSHAAVAWRFWPPIPSHVPFPFATSHHLPNLRVPWFPDPVGPLCGPCHTPVLAPRAHSIPHPVFIPHRATSNPLARAHRILIRPGTVSCSLHGSFLSTPLLPRTRRVLLRTFRSGSSGHFSHVMAPLAHLCIGTRTQRVEAAVAQQGRHYTYPD